MQQWHTIEALTEAEDSRIFIETGIDHGRRGEWKKAIFYLGYVADRSSKGVALPGAYFSYLGYAVARLQGRTAEGLELCEKAVEIEIWDPENWANLARVQMLAGKRRQAVRSVRQGMKFDAQNPILQDVLRDLGIRRGVVIPFLSRSNPVNVVLGLARSRISKALGLSRSSNRS